MHTPRCRFQSPGPIAGMFAKDPNLRKSRLSAKARIMDTVDVDSATKAFADMLAKRGFGKGAHQSA
jgi:hypothetical protein